MSFRIKERYFKGFTKSDKYNPKEPVMDGDALIHERRALNALHIEMSSVESEIERKKMYKANAKAVARKAPGILGFELTHGDNAVMEGLKCRSTSRFEHLEHSAPPTPTSAREQPPMATSPSRTDQFDGGEDNLLQNAYSPDWTRVTATIHAQ